MTMSCVHFDDDNGALPAAAKPLQCASALWCPLPRSRKPLVLSRHVIAVFKIDDCSNVWQTRGDDDGGDSDIVAALMAMKMTGSNDGECLLWEWWSSLGGGGQLSSLGNRLSSSAAVVGTVRRGDDSSDSGKGSSGENRRRHNNQSICWHLLHLICGGKIAAVLFGPAMIAAMSLLSSSAVGKCDEVTMAATAAKPIAAKTQQSINIFASLASCLWRQESQLVLFGAAVIAAMSWESSL